MTYSNFCAQYNFRGCVGNADAQLVFDYLSQPQTVANMLVFSDIGLPALSGIAHILEQNYAHAAAFPLSDFRNRQIVGRMVCFILEHFGYKKVSGGVSKDTRLRDFSKANLFKTCSVYQLMTTPVHTIQMRIV